MRFLPGSRSILVLFATLSIIAVVVGPTSQAAPGKRPAPEPVWAMQIPDSLNLVGMPNGYLYKNGDPYVRVTVQKATTGSVVTRTTFHFFIYPSTTPPQVWAKFQGIYPSVTLAADPGPGGYCGFPAAVPQDGSPACFTAFINSEHPKPGYEHLLFYFWIEGDIEDPARYPLGSEVQLTGNGAFTINIWNDFDPIFPDDPEPYQTVVARLVGGDNEPPRGFFVTRSSSNSWEFRVEQKMFDFSQAYHWAETVIGRNGKPTTVVTGYKPLTGQGELSFALRLFKNPAAI